MIVIRTRNLVRFFAVQAHCTKKQRLNGWTTCDFASFSNFTSVSTVFQSYQADGRLILKGSAPKEIISQTDLYLVILSSKTYVFTK